MGNILRKPYARQLSRFVHKFSGSGCLNASSTVDQVITYPRTGYDYAWLRTDLSFTATDSRLVELYISGSRQNKIYSNTESGNDLILLGGWEYTINRYDLVRLKVGAASGYVHYKIFTEEI